MPRIVEYPFLIQLPRQREGGTFIEFVVSCLSPLRLFNNSLFMQIPSWTFRRLDEKNFVRGHKSIEKIDVPLQRTGCIRKYNLVFDGLIQCSAFCCTKIEFSNFSLVFFFFFFFIFCPRRVTRIPVVVNANVIVNRYDGIEAKVFSWNALINHL